MAKRWGKMETVRFHFLGLQNHCRWWLQSGKLKGPSFWASLVAQMVKNLPVVWETQVWSLGWEDPLEKGMAAHSSMLAWKIPWTDEPGKLQSMGSQRLGHDWATNTFVFSFLLGRKAMTNLDSILKSRDITLSRKVHIVKTIVFPLVMYGCESCTIKKAECWRIAAFELWCWRRLLRVPWTARRWN